MSEAAAWLFCVALGFLALIWWVSLLAGPSGDDFQRACAHHQGVAAVDRHHVLAVTLICRDGIVVGGDEL